jgi:hypothetical protein
MSNGKRYFNMEEAIKNGKQFYWDNYALDEGRSGGVKCPKCLIWIEFPRKRKNHLMTWIKDCENCEIKDPFRRMWHQFNSCCDDDQREIYNAWLRKLRSLSSEFSIDILRHIQDLPFFEGVSNE